MPFPTLEQFGGPSRMPMTEDLNHEALRASIAWSLQLADNLNENLIAAYLAEALNIAEKGMEKHSDSR